MHQIKRYSEEQCTHWSELDRVYLDQSITEDRDFLEHSFRYESELDGDFLEHFTFKGQLLGTLLDIVGLLF